MASTTQIIYLRLMSGQVLEYQMAPPAIPEDMENEEGRTWIYENASRFSHHMSRMEQFILEHMELDEGYEVSFVCEEEEREIEEEVAFRMEEAKQGREYEMLEEEIAEFLRRDIQHRRKLVDGMELMVCVTEREVCLDDFDEEYMGGF
jgi:hypothetical protein